MKVTRREIITIEMESRDFDSLMFFLNRCGSQTELGEIDSEKAREMYNIFKAGMNEEPK